MPETGPLDGIRFLVTRPKGAGEALAERLSSLGASAVAFPTIRIEPLQDFARLDAALGNLDSYDWLVFTSANGVEAAFERLSCLGLPGPEPGRPRVAAIGPATAGALTERGVSPERTPERFIAESLADSLGPVAGQRILLPRAEAARPILREMLAERGALVDEIAIYRAAPVTPSAEALEWLDQGVDMVTFTSPSTVGGLRQALQASGRDADHLPGDPLFACIGPITARASRNAGYPPSIVAEEHTSEGLVQAIVSYFHTSRRRQT